MAVRRTRAHDAEAAEALSDHVKHWAQYQKLAGEHDTVERCVVAGTYDWRAYLQEEIELACRREEKPRDKKQAERPRPEQPPAGFYA